MEPNDQPRAAAENYIRDAVKILQRAQSRGLNHSDEAVARTAVVGLRIVLRSAFALVAVDDLRIAMRLLEVAAELQTCIHPDAAVACKEVEAAASIFQAMADGY